MRSVPALHDCLVLILEDEPLIALDLAEEVAAHGGRPVVTCTVGQALSALSRVKFGAAIIDHLHGHDGTSAEVVECLHKLHTPFVVYSGYDEPGHWGDAPVVSKPAAQEHLMHIVEKVLR